MAAGHGERGTQVFAFQACVSMGGPVYTMSLTNTDPR